MNNKLSLSQIEPKFNRQIEALERTNIPQHIVNHFRRQKYQILSTAWQIQNEADEHIILLFAPVIPFLFCDPHNQMQAIQHNEHVGCCYLEKNEINTVEKTPDQPYFIYGITIPHTANNMQMETVIEKITHENSPYLPLTAEETIALCRHTDILSYHAVFAPGSRYGKEKNLNIQIGHDKRPKLEWLPARQRYENRVTPVCRLRTNENFIV